MSSIGDPGKLKVVELRSELSKRGLDTKGNKPALVKRLKDALETELDEEIPDTSIADTSTEDVDSSVSEPSEPVEPKKPPEVRSRPAPASVKRARAEKAEDANNEPPPAKTPTKAELKSPPDAPTIIENVEESTADIDEEAVEEEVEQSDEKVQPPENIEEEEPIIEAPPLVEEKEQSEEAPSIEAAEESEQRDENGGNFNEDQLKEDDNTQNSDIQMEVQEVSEVSGDMKESEKENKGEKRKHEPSSPERSSRRRSRSPIKEDEPNIDPGKVQLSWYDSDLNLQLDKESFLSARPYHDGAFGFAYAGARATHGINCGKAWFEVKITEELKWDDFSKQSDKHSRHHQRRSPSRQSSRNQDEKREERSQDEKREERSAKPEGDEVEIIEDAKTQEEVKENITDQITDKPEEKESEKIADDKDSDVEMIEESAKTEESEKPEEEKSENTSENTETPEDTIKEDTNKEDTIKEDTNKEIKKEEQVLQPHVFRIGWSVPNTGLQLGEETFSYGYENTGKFVTEGKYEDYGVTFGVGDVIASFLEINDENLTISYSVNGKSQSVAVQVPKSELPEDFAFFPHITSRNYAFDLNLGSLEPWFPLSEGFESFPLLDKVDDKVSGPARPENRSECEVILMCGLPASGKTHWVRDYVKSNLDKKYTLLGDAHFLDKMTISGDSFKSKYKGSWTVVLDKLQKSINKLVEIAALRRRNYIIDQTNVFPSAQRRKLRLFEGFKRRAVVVIVGDEEYAKRQSLQEAQGGKDVPDSAVLEMKANMQLPQKGDWLDEIIYAGVGEDEAKVLVQKYNTQGRDAGYGIQRRFSQRDDRSRWQNRRNDYRGSNFRDHRNYPPHHRYDRGPPHRGGWFPRRPPGPPHWNRSGDRRAGPPPPHRDWRSRHDQGGRSDRPNQRDNRQVQPQHRANRSGGNASNTSWNQSSGGSGGSGANWNQGGGQWNGQGWGNQWQTNPWNQSQSQNHYKYGGGGGGGQGYGQYAGWGYYGQYAQGWNSQGQTANASGTNTNQYGQYSQQDWAQYAQQYAQQGQQTATGQIDTNLQK